MKTLLIFTFLLISSIGHSSEIELQDYNRIIAKFEKLYGRKIIFKKDWKNKEENAFSRVEGGKHYIISYGGYARMNRMTESAYALVLCHEVGHHLGNSPKMKGQYSWASAEGQADYYATASCMRTYLADWPLEKLLQTDTLQEITDECERAYLNELEAAICIQSANAAVALINIFDKEEHQNSFKYSILTPSNKKVIRTIVDKYPDDQCRLDTYYAGALHRERPSCWFAN